MITRAGQPVAAGDGPDWDAYVDAGGATDAADTAARTALAAIGADR